MSTYIRDLFKAVLTPTMGLRCPPSPKYGSGELFVDRSLAVIQYQVHSPAPANVWPRIAEVAEEVRFLHPDFSRASARMARWFGLR